MGSSRYNFCDPSYKLLCIYILYKYKIRVNPLHKSTLKGICALHLKLAMDQGFFFFWGGGCVRLVLLFAIFVKQLVGKYYFMTLIMVIENECFLLIEVFDDV